MDNLNDIKSYVSNINTHIDNILVEVNKLIPEYNSLFSIENIFSSENGGKTRLNRQVFNDTHEIVKESINKINLEIDEILLILRQTMRQMLLDINDFESTQDINLVLDDALFFESLQKDMNSKNITSQEKQRIYENIKEIFSIKNRIFNFGYFIDMFDTSIFEGLIYRLGVEDLINSSIIFEVIDSYALQFELLKSFSNEIKNLNNTNVKITNLNNLNLLLELHKRRMENFTYLNVKYKVFIDYSCNVPLSKPIYLNKAYLENILSCLIEQSCFDVIKKELKKGKIQKQIDVNIGINKDTLKIVVKNNGYEVKDVNNLFISDMDNKYIIEARNLINEINGKFDIRIPDNNEGMQYSLIVKLK